MRRIFPVRTACPADRIRIRNRDTSGLAAAVFSRHRRPQEFELDVGHCLLCGLCAEAGPEDVLVMDGRRPWGSRLRRDLILDTEDLQLPAATG